MKNITALLVAVGVLFVLSSYTQRKETYSFRYFKTELKKKDKIKSFSWGNKETTMHITPHDKGVDIIVDDLTYSCKPFVVKQNLKGTTGTATIEGVKRSVKVIIYNDESSTVPQAKIEVFEDGKSNIKKFWYGKPGYYEEN